MADLELGLATSFYLYPCGLFAALFSSQLIRYRYRADEPAAATNNSKVPRRLYTNLIWIFQLILSPLLVCICLHKTNIVFIKLTTM